MYVCTCTIGSLLYYINGGCGYVTLHCWLLLQGSSAEAKALATAISQKLDKLEKELKSALTTSVSIIVLYICSLDIT